MVILYFDVLFLWSVLPQASSRLPEPSGRRSVLTIPEKCAIFYKENTNVDSSCHEYDTDDHKYLTSILNPSMNYCLYCK